jgi:NAD(P)-dependent dehydrogenase (short-subunit alcohol dehydrogenase family)
LHELRDRIAVVTGAASGIGRALADAFAARGMKVVLCDIEAKALALAVDEVGKSGADVLGVRADVSRAEDVEILARKTLDEFGAAHVICNNAGVGSAPRPAWESSAAEWEWTLGVNLMGVVHGTNTFLPILLQQEEPGHIVNTASIAGLITGWGNAPHSAASHAVVAFSESLYADLRARDAAIGVSVLCPAFVHTNLDESERNAPADLRGRSSGREAPAGAWLRKQLEQGMPPERVADAALDAIESDRFYVLTHPEWLELVTERFRNLRGGLAPTPAHLPR